MGKASVYIRFEDGKRLPAVCVKPPPLFQRLPEDLKKAPQKIIDRAYEEETEAWWHLTPEAAADEFLRHLFPMASAHAAGRSNGWLVVENLGDPEEWSLVKHKQWERFERAIKASIVDAEKRFQDRICKALKQIECPKSPTFVHEANMDRIVPVLTPGFVFVDFACKHCGHLGCVKIEEDNINWE